MVFAGVLWTVAGIVREATGATGDLTTGRSLLPDLFALPGYAAFGVALHGLLAARGGDRERDLLLDGLMIAIGASLVVHQFLVAPTLALTDSWVVARIAIIIYPSISMWLLVLAGRLAFSGVERSPANFLLLAGTASLVIGDVVFAAGEIGRINLDEAALAVPYLLVPALIGSALLHPSMRDISRREHRDRPTLTRSRMALVGVALLAPVVVLFSDDSSETRVIALVLCEMLAIVAVLRVFYAMRLQTQTQATLAHRATHDELTDLPGRQLLTRLADERLAETPRTPVAMLFIDLDQFKNVNDSLGHGYGDRLLIQVGERLTRMVPDEAVVSRFSGDEFLVLAPNLDTHAALALGDELRAALSRCFVLEDGTEMFVSASIGITTATSGCGVGATTLIQEADAAMYESKEMGRNAVTLFDRSMRDRLDRRMRLERDLRTAVDGLEIRVVYQPIVAWPERRLLGFEALARWRREGEDVPPDEFVAIAEDSGLIIALGEFVLDEACRQLVWLRQHVEGAHDAFVSVNVSPRQLRSGDVVDVVAETLERHGLTGEALYLEITEGVMMVDAVAAAAALAGIGALGVRLSVDDFGTGFSSLAYLKRLPVDAVKIDRSFVADLGRTSADEPLIAAIIRMSSALGLVTVAEGVETEEQAMRLGELGCHQMQGYLFGRPVPVIELPAVVADLHRTATRPTGRRSRCTVVPS
jgi:diguanylate cyclase (GGDEF)-like protein